jgi:hypothetical protein
MHVLLLVLT